MERIGDILKRVTPDHQPSENKEPSPAPEYKCKYCKDAHFVYPLKENGQPDRSTVIPCRHCISPERLCRMLGISSLSSTFANFEVVKGAEDAFKAASLIATLETEWKLLLIYGRWGNGKTHLLEAITLSIWDRGYKVRIQTFPDFMARLKGTFDKTTEPEDMSFNTLMGNLCTMPYLLLDDVGTAGSFTPFSLDQLERIMLARYRDNLFTVITTNLDYEDLPRFVTSRFSDSEKARIVWNEAPDYRPKKKAKHKETERR